MDWVHKLKQQYAIAVRPEWMEKVLTQLQAANPDFGTWSEAQTVEKIFTAYLFCDLNQAGAAALPANTKAMHKEVLSGKFVLQLDEVVNMAAAARERYTDQAGNRCLKFALTDGCQQVVGVEHCHMPAITWDCPAGSKLLIHNVPIRRGLLLLGPDNTALLGGQVERLEAARQRAVAAWTKPVVGRPPNSGERDIFGEARQAAWAPGAPPAPGQPQQQHPQQPQHPQQQQHPPHRQQQAAPPMLLATAAGPAAALQGGHAVNGPGAYPHQPPPPPQAQPPPQQQYPPQHQQQHPQMGPPPAVLAAQAGLGGMPPGQEWRQPQVQPHQHRAENQPAQARGPAAAGASASEGGWLGHTRGQPATFPMQDSSSDATPPGPGADPGADGMWRGPGAPPVAPAAAAGNGWAGGGAPAAAAAGPSLPSARGGMQRMGGGAGEGPPVGASRRVSAVDLVTSSASISGGSSRSGSQDGSAASGGPSNPPPPPPPQQQQPLHPGRRLPQTSALGAARQASGSTGVTAAPSHAAGTGVGTAAWPPLPPHPASAATATPHISSSGLLPPRPNTAASGSNPGVTGAAGRPGVFSPAVTTTSGSAAGCGYPRKPALPLARSSPGHSCLSGGGGGGRGGVTASPSVSSHGTTGSGSRPGLGGGAATATAATASAGATPSGGGRGAAAVHPRPMADDVDMVDLAALDDEDGEGAEVDGDSGGGGGVAARVGADEGGPPAAAGHRGRGATGGGTKGRLPPPLEPAGPVEKRPRLSPGGGWLGGGETGGSRPVGHGAIPAAAAQGDMAEMDEDPAGYGYDVGNGYDDHGGYSYGDDDRMALEMMNGPEEQWHDEHQLDGQCGLQDELQDYQRQQPQHHYQDQDPDLPPPSLQQPQQHPGLDEAPPAVDHAGVVSLCQVPEMCYDSEHGPAIFPFTVDVYGVFNQLDSDTAVIEDGTYVMAAQLTDAAMAPLLARAPPPGDYLDHKPTGIEEIQVMADSEDPAVRSYCQDLVNLLMDFIKNFSGTIRLEFSGPPPAQPRIIWLQNDGDDSSSGEDGGAPGRADGGGGGCDQYEAFVRALMGASDQDAVGGWEQGLPEGREMGE